MKLAIGQKLMVLASRLGGKLAAPEPGRRAKKTEDWASMWLGDITPAKAKSALRSAAEGSPAEQDTIFDRMLETDISLRVAWYTRRDALRGLEWNLQPADKVRKNAGLKEARAKDICDWCYALLAGINGWEGAVCELTEAIGRGTAVVEIEYEGGRPIAAWPVNRSILSADDKDPMRLRMQTDDSGYAGQPIDEFPLGKFLCHTPDPLGGQRNRGGLLRVATTFYIAKHLGFRWWLIFLEVFGSPITVGKYRTDATPTEKAAILEMIKDMGTARGGMFPSGTEIQIIESALASKGTKSPHEMLEDYIDRRFAVLFLGQELTTAMSESGGSQAAANVHDRVRLSLRKSDNRAIGETIRRDLLVPLCGMKYGDDAQIYAPYFSLIVEDPRDREAEGRVISIAVNDLGAVVPASVVPERLGLPLSDQMEPDEPLPGRTIESPFGSMTNSETRIAKAGRGRRCDHSSSFSLQSCSSALSSQQPSLGSSWVEEVNETAVDHAKDVIAHVSVSISGYEDSAAALRIIDELIGELDADKLAATEQQFLLASRLAGMAEARDRLTTKSTKVLSSSRSSRSKDRFALADRAAYDFANIPFTQAIELLRDRLGLDPDTFEELSAQARSRAWRVAGIYDMQLLADVHRELLASIKTGETLRDFRLRLPQMAERRGWTGANPWHATIVHRQNYFMATAAGRYKEYREFDVAAFEIVTRPGACADKCLPFNGMIFSIGDTRYFTPLHWGCYCTERPIFAWELRPDQVQQSADVSVPALDEELQKPSALKWDVQQYANLEPVDLSQFPPELQPAFEEFAKEKGWRIQGVEDSSGTEPGQ